MLACKHEPPEYLGEQKADDGVNVCSKCKNCGSLAVVTPSRAAFSVKGINQGDAHPSPRKKGSN